MVHQAGLAEENLTDDAALRACASKNVSDPVDAMLKTPENGGKTRPTARFFSNKDLARLFVPLTVEQGLEYLVGLAASIMVASVGEAAVSGVSLVEFLMAFFISLFAALSAGGTVIAGQYLGRGNTPMARKGADQLVWFVGVVALGMMLVVLLGEEIILDGLFGQIEPDVRENAQTYLRTAVFSIPALALYNAGAAIFRTMGNSRLPMLASLFMGILNVAGSATALYFLKTGTAGVATSALISRWAAAVIILWLVLNPALPLHLSRRLRHRFRWDIIKRIMGIGIPFGLENGLFYLGRIAVLGLVATYGTAAIAANAVAGTLVMFNVLPGMAVGLGMTAVIARCVGPGDYEQARYYTRKILIIVYGAHFVVSGLLFAALPLIFRAYSLPSEATGLAWELVVWHMGAMVFIWPLAYTLPITFRAAGDARYPRIVGIAAMFGCRIVMAYVLGTLLGTGVLGTWWAMFLDWLVKAGLFAYRYFSGKWTRFRAI